MIVVSTYINLQNIKQQNLKKPTKLGDALLCEFQTNVGTILSYSRWVTYNKVKGERGNKKRNSRSRTVGSRHKDER